MFRRSVVSLVLICCAMSPLRAEETVETDLLVVGGSESAVAAAVQAARLGVKSVVLVNDIDWLGGQFTAEGLCAVDEWTIYKGNKSIFPRSGMFLEIMDRIEADMTRKYGLSRPGNSFCAWTTCEPRDTERLFRELVKPHLAENGGPIRMFENFEPQSVAVEENQVRQVTFESTRQTKDKLSVRAKLTIDASDWGDVVRLSGAEYFAGPDLKSRFQEPSAPEDGQQVQPNEMNPLTYCLVLRESDEPAVVARPPHFDDRIFFGTTSATREEYKKLGWPKGTMGPFAPAWRDSTMAKGPYNEPPTVYTHRRLVDRRHNKLATGTESVLVNWPLQDYPTYDFPAHVAEALEKTERGASQKNLVNMSYAQRRIVFDDVKQHALGMLHHLQTTVFDKDPSQAVTFRNMRLTDEFGTADRLPPKPYVREALRLSAMYILREQDLRDTDGVQSWANHMAPDSVFGFQFNIDFHPTRRIYLNDDRSGPWAHIHSSYRNWGTHTDRAGLPLRSLVPVKLDGLLTAGKSLGLTSIVSSAVRLHGHGMLSGQASGTIAAVCLERKLKPREIARQMQLTRRVQEKLVAPPVDDKTNTTPPGVLLWPYQDLPPSDPAFVAANQLAVRAILPGEPGEQDFNASKIVTQQQLAETLRRAARSVGSKQDVTPSDSSEPATVASFAQQMKRLGWEVSSTEDATLTRGVLAIELWNAIGKLPERTFDTPENVPTDGADTDGDGLDDLEDPLPLDRDNDSVPDRLEKIE